MKPITKTLILILLISDSLTKFGTLTDNEFEKVKFIKSKLSSLEQTYLQEKVDLARLKIKKNERLGKNEETNNYIKFVSGIGIGYGLNVEATEDLKNCFIYKKDNHKIEDFLIRTEESTGQVNLKQKSLENQKQITKSFTSKALELFATFKDCAPFRETIFTFIKNRLLSIGIKGVAYAVGGIIGVLIKSTYDLYKLLNEIQNFYINRKKQPLDYIKLGSSVGKIIYYTQNLLMKKKKKL